MVTVLLVWMLQAAVVVDQYRARIIGPLPATTVVWEGLLPGLSIRCGLPRPSETTEPEVPNPRGLRWSDPADLTKDCAYRDDDMSGPIANLPPSDTATYRLELSGRAEAGWLPVATSVNVFSRRGQSRSAAASP